MHPILWQCGPLTLYSYGVALAAAFLIGSWVAQRTMRQAHRLGARVILSPAQVADFVLWLLVGSLLGARALYILANLEHYRQSPWEMLAIWHGGLIFYGGLATGALAGWWYLRRQRLLVGAILDLFTPALAAGHAIGRVGCFLNGCCYGKPTAGPWGVRFPWSELPRYPTQLMESAFALIAAFVFMRWLFTRRPWERPPHGRVALTYVLVYACWRFALEFLRGDNPPLAWGLNLPQWVSLALVLGCGVWLRRLITKSPPRAAAG